MLDVGGRCRCGSSRSPAREHRGASERGSPVHPRQARHVAGLRVQPIGALPGSSPQALVPCGRPLPCGGWPEPLGHPGQALGHPDAPLGGGPCRSRPAHRPRTTRPQLGVTPPQATTPGLPSLRAWTGVPSGATRARGAMCATPTGPSGSVLPLENGSGLSLGITSQSDAGFYPRTRREFHRRQTKRPPESSL